MPTYRLLIEYEGTKFAGWQVQTHGRTVQGVLLEALREVTRERDIDLQGAGRTDAGVHALAQVASLRCRSRINPRQALAALEQALPADLAVRGFAEAPRSFHARHDAVARAYRYQIVQRRSAFGKRFTWWTGALNVPAMRRAAGAFVGRHDFAAFARRAGEHDSTLVELAECEVHAADEWVLIRVVASHFVWNQVRRMVGALVTVGRGEAAPEDVPRWLAGALAPPPLAAPAAGLFLEAVQYAGEPLFRPPAVPIGVPAANGPQRGDTLN